MLTVRRVAAALWFQTVAHFARPETIISSRFEHAARREITMEQQSSDHSIEPMYVGARLLALCTQQACVAFLEPSAIRL